MQDASLYKKLGVLCVLSLIGSVYVILLRYSRVIKGLKYSSTTVVALQEVVKMVLVCGVLFYNCAGIKEVMHLLKRDVVDNKAATLKMAAPSCLYALQNNMVFVALEHINVPTQQVLFQLKIPFTAILCVLWLKKTLSWQQWLAVSMIFAGTGAIEYQTGYNKVATNTLKHIVQPPSENLLVGSIAVIIASLCSAFAGVYFEKILKSEESSIWIKNFQMYLWSIPITLISVALQDASLISNQGFFFDYTITVWLIVFISSVGGILVSLVLLYTDNVTKCFSASTSILLSTVASYLLFDYHIGAYFILGMILVCSAIFIYAIPIRSCREKQQIAVEKS